MITNLMDKSRSLHTGAERGPCGTTVVLCPSKELRGDGLGIPSYFSHPSTFATSEKW